MPPNEGFACGLHLINVSEGFLIPSEVENLRNSPFIKKERKAVLKKNKPYVKSRYNPCDILFYILLSDPKIRI